MTTTDDLIVRAQAVPRCSICDRADCPKMLRDATPMTPGVYDAFARMLADANANPPRPLQATDRAIAEKHADEGLAADEDCRAHTVDWRERCLAAEARLADPARGLTVGAPFRDARRHPRFLDGTAIISLYGSEDEHQIRSTDKHGAFLRDTHHADAFHTRWRRRDGRWSHWHYADIADDDQPCRLVPLADADRDPDLWGPL